MKRIAIITSTRAEYGLLTPLIRRVAEDDELELDLIVTGTHLSEKYGHTIDDIKKDRFPIAHELSILEEDNTPYGISLTLANAVRSFAVCFKDDRPDMAVILGDRTEMLGVAVSAMNERIPVAHIHGGEVTEGAVDDCVRHAITKMSYLHFTSTEMYRRRVIQLGEFPERVFNTGSLGAENILRQPLYKREELLSCTPELSGAEGMPFSVVTFHPVTLEDGTTGKQVEALCLAMAERKDIFFLVTAANADAGGEEANRILRRFCDAHANAAFVHNLGMKRYLSAVKYASFVLGNSSSGLLEAPVLGTPTVNIGDRQKGRLASETVISCGTKKPDILEAMRQASMRKHVPVNLYGNATASEQMVLIMKDYLLNDSIDLKKGFYDIDISEEGREQF